MTGVQATARHMGRPREQVPNSWRCAAACLCVCARVRGRARGECFSLKGPFCCIYTQTDIHILLLCCFSLLLSFHLRLAHVHTHTHTTLPPGLPTSLWSYYLSFIIYLTRGFPPHSFPSLLLPLSLPIPSLPPPAPLFLSTIPRTTLSPASIFARSIEAFQSRRSGIPALAGTERICRGDMKGLVSVCVARYGGSRECVLGTIWRVS
jgi:hypothetical protein